MQEKDWYAEYVEMMKDRHFGEGSRMLTEEEFYKNFPDCKPKKGGKK